MSGLKSLSPAGDLDRIIAADYPLLEELYRDLHANPELSDMEERTAAKLGAQLRAAGYEVAEKFGGYGIVGLLKNGPGPTLMIRADMDALPVEEETGLAYASKVWASDPSGRRVPVMHACGHDLHTTVLVGSARSLARLRNRWSGTLLLIGQGAEETSKGARAMIEAGLYRKFPRPDYAVALHDSPLLSAGILGIAEGFVMANVDTAVITVRGSGGHGAYPHLTKDPIVLAARIVLALQTIVSRETKPLDPAVITVGSIHGGTAPNIIPDRVELEVTIRSFSDKLRLGLIEAIRRICRGEALAAGLAEDLMPIVRVVGEGVVATYNDPALTRRVREALTKRFGPDCVVTVDAEMCGEDFGQFRCTDEKVPICLFWLGAVAPEKWAESRRTGVPLPGLHSGKFAPVPEPSIKTGVAAMTTIALELLASNDRK